MNPHNHVATDSTSMIESECQTDYRCRISWPIPNTIAQATLHCYFYHNIDLSQVFSSRRPMGPRPGAMEIPAVRPCVRASVCPQKWFPEHNSKSFQYISVGLYKRLTCIKIEVKFENGDLDLLFKVTGCYFVVDTYSSITFQVWDSVLQFFACGCILRPYFTYIQGFAQKHCLFSSSLLALVFWDRISQTFIVFVISYCRICFSYLIITGTFCCISISYLFP